VLIAALPHTKYAYEPGTGFIYSNIGYAILGAALGRASGLGYVEYVRQRIFKPLGMVNTAFEPDDQIRANISRGYVKQKDKVDWETPEREHQGRGYKVPNGAIYTTVTDLARFVAFEMGQGPASVLKKESLDDNFKRIITANAGLDDGYGLGFQVTRYKNIIAFGHGGAVAGYLAAAYFDRKSQTGVIVLRNAIGGNLDISELAMETLNKVADIKAAAAQQAAAGVKVDPKIYDAYVGRCEVPTLGVLNITREGDKLFGQPDGESKEELIPQSETQFSVGNIGIQVTFVRDEKGQVAQMIIKRGEHETRGSKIK